MILKFNDFINKTRIDEVQQGVDVTTYRWDANAADIPSFDAVFRIYDIADSTMERMLGKSYPADCQISNSCPLRWKRIYQTRRTGVSQRCIEGIYVSV